MKMFSSFKCVFCKVSLSAYGIFATRKLELVQVARVRYDSRMNATRECVCKTEVTRKMNGITREIRNS